jgi:hypothetical protein
MTERVCYCTRSIHGHKLEVIFQFHTAVGLFPEEQGTVNFAKRLRLDPRDGSVYVGLRNSISSPKEIQPRFISKQKSIYQRISLNI